MKNIILVDIDHTLTDAFWRDEMIGIAPWDEYHAAGINDDPAHDFVKLLSLIGGSKVKFVGLTSRPEKFRQLTMEWMVKNKVMVLDDILMRPSNDFRPAPDVKIALCEEKYGPDWRDKILCLIDDNDRVIEAFKGEGITCLQVFNRRGRK